MEGEWEVAEGRRREKAVKHVFSLCLLSFAYCVLCVCVVCVSLFVHLNVRMCLPYLYVLVCLDPPVDWNCEERAMRGSHDLRGTKMTARGDLRISS